MGGGGTREIRLPRPPGGTAPWLVGAGLAGLALVTVVTASGPVDVLSVPRSVTGTARPSPPPSVPPSSPTATTTTTGPFGDLSQLPDAARRCRRGHSARRRRSVPLGDLDDLPVRVAQRPADEQPHRSAAGRSRRSPPCPTSWSRRRRRDSRCFRSARRATRSSPAGSTSRTPPPRPGLPRHPAETSAEYTIRVLHTWDIAPAALGGLAELYREARYSRHPVTEDTATRPSPASRPSTRTCSESPTRPRPLRPWPRPRPRPGG